MKNRIAIISASIRTGRKSHRVALYLEKKLQAPGTETEMLDLAELDFPLFHERLKYLKDPSEKVLRFARTINECQGVIIVTPEYNGGYPASLKNVVDLLYDEWHRKPVAISTFSSGAFGGSQVITSLQFTLWKMRAWTVPAMLPVANIDSVFPGSGELPEDNAFGNRAQKFLDELMWCIEASAHMKNK